MCDLRFLAQRSPVAQLVEQVAVNHFVGGSNPSGRVILSPVRFFAERGFLFTRRLFLAETKIQLRPFEKAVLSVR